MDETQRAIEEGIRRGIESADRGPELTDGLMAVGDAGAFLATLALIVLAMQRMRHTRERADVAEGRPRLPPTRSRLCVRRPPRTPSGGSSTRRTRGRTSSGSRDADKQTRALGTLARATRNAPRAQLQPTRTARRSPAPGDEFDVSEGLFAVPLYLTNEGTALRSTSTAASRSAASGTRSAVGCGSAPRVRASPFHGRARRDPRATRRYVLPAIDRPASPRGRPERSRGGGPLVALERRVRRAIRDPEQHRPGEPATFTRVGVQLPPRARKAADRERPQTDIAHRLGCLERDLGAYQSNRVPGPRDSGRG
jgi:hypothetical protein